MKGSLIPASIIIISLYTLSLSAPILPLHDPNRIDLSSIERPPEVSHPFGTDNKGRDILSRVIYGAKISITVSLAAAIVSTAIGLCIGLAAGYFGGRSDVILMGLVDFTLSFPTLLLAIAISVVLPPGVLTVMIAISLVNWTSFARLIRSKVLTIKGMAYIEAARGMGAGNLRIIVNHIMPQCLPLASIMMGIKMGGFILTEATLSFLGLGAQPPTPTWGYMVSANRAYILSAPWMVIFPGIAITITALCFNLIGEGLRARYEIVEKEK